VPEHHLQGHEVQAMVIVPIAPGRRRPRPNNSDSTPEDGLGCYRARHRAHTQPLILLLKVACTRTDEVSRDMGQRTPMPALEPVISMVVTAPPRPGNPPCKDSFIRKHGVNYEEIDHESLEVVNHPKSNGGAWRFREFP
jgi:hypothetical protein